jgi:hypothetical protein
MFPTPVILKGSDFESLEHIQNNMTAVLKGLSENDFQ